MYIFEQLGSSHVWLEQNSSSTPPITSSVDRQQTALNVWFYEVLTCLKLSIHVGYFPESKFSSLLLFFVLVLILQVQLLTHSFLTLAFFS